MKSFSKKHLSLFFFVTFLFTWSLWLSCVFFDFSELTSKILILIGAFGPSLAGIAMTYSVKNKDEIKDYWRRFFSFKRISIKWYLVILLFFPLITAISFFIGYVMGFDTPSMDNLLKVVSDPVSLILFVIVMILGGPLAEELGWRGFALDYLQNNGGIFSANTILGFVWALWHLPLFFIFGTTHEWMGFGSWESVLWVAQVMIITHFYTCVYNANNRSIFSAFLIHFMSNSTTTLIIGLGAFSMPLHIEISKTILYFLGTFLVISVVNKKIVSSKMH